MIVKASTDNYNRTSAQIRHIFNRYRFLVSLCYYVWQFTLSFLIHFDTFFLQVEAWDPVGTSLFCSKEEDI